MRSEQLDNKAEGFPLFDSKGGDSGGGLANDGTGGGPATAPEEFSPSTQLIELPKGHTLQCAQ